MYSLTISVEYNDTILNASIYVEGYVAYDDINLFTIVDALIFVVPGLYEFKLIYVLYGPGYFF